MNLQEARTFLSRNITKTRYAAREQRSLDFEIDTDYVVNLLILQKGKCALTGQDMEFTRGGPDGKNNGKNPNGCSIDRIDGNLGYIKGNIQLTRWLPNRIKSSMHNNEFIKMCNDVVNHTKGT